MVKNVWRGFSSGERRTGSGVTLMKGRRVARGNEGGSKI